MKSKILIVFISAIFMFSMLGCNINIVSESPNLELTAAVQALAIQQTQAALAQQSSSQTQPTVMVIVVTATSEVALPATHTAEPTATSVQNPEIINSTLCWVGPGGKYEVVSALSKGQFVEVIGRGNTDGWIIIKNPIYKDPCWVQSFDIKLDPGLDVKSLQVFYPPVAPTKTPPPLPTPTP